MENLNDFSLDPAPLRVEEVQEQEPIPGIEDAASLPIPDIEVAASLRKCVICHEPLEDWQQPLTAQVYHRERECTKCVYCHNEVARDRIATCLKNEDVIAHSPCRDKAVAAEYESRPVTITQSHLDYLNRLTQFAYRPSPGLTIEELQETAVLSSSQFIKDMSMEDKFRHMKMMEAATANVSIAIHNDKEKIRLKVGREDIEKHVKIRDLQKVHDASYQRDKQQWEKEERRKTAAVKQDPAVRAREKTINQMVGMGFTKETAEAFIDKQKNAALGGTGEQGK